MKQFLIATLFVLLLAGCKKEELPAPATSPNTNLLTARAWLYDEYYSGHGTASQKRLYKRNAPGNSADYSVYQYVFKKDGNLEVKVGSESMFSTWKFTDNETTIEITSGSGSLTRLKVESLNGESFDWTVESYYAKMIPK